MGFSRGRGLIVVRENVSVIFCVRCNQGVPNGDIRGRLRIRILLLGGGGGVVLC